MAKAAKGEKGLAARVSRLEAEMKEQRATLPARPEDVVARQSMEQQVADQMARLQGSRTASVVPDDLRGAASPIGFGTGSRRRR
jgi:hypothetical protein